MAEYCPFISTRMTEPDPLSLLAQLRATVDATAGVQHTAGPSYVVKKETPWTPDDVVAAQTAIDTAPESSPRIAAQEFLDNLPPQWRAFLPLFVKQLNVIRTSLATPLPPITGAQLLNAFRNEAGSL